MNGILTMENGAMNVNTIITETEVVEAMEVVIEEEAAVGSMHHWLHDLKEKQLFTQLMSQQMAITTIRTIMVIKMGQMVATMTTCRWTWRIFLMDLQRYYFFLRKFTNLLAIPLYLISENPSY